MERLVGAAETLPFSVCAEVLAHIELGLRLILQGPQVHRVPAVDCVGVARFPLERGLSLVINDYGLGQGGSEILFFETRTLPGGAWHRLKIGSLRRISESYRR